MPIHYCIFDMESPVKWWRSSAKAKQQTVHLASERRREPRIGATFKVRYSGSEGNNIIIGHGTIIDLIHGVEPDGRLDHFCLVIDPTDLAALAASGEFDVTDGPATRYGARGNGTSLYVRDPAGNSVELITPGLWGLPSGW